MMKHIFPPMKFRNTPRGGGTGEGRNTCPSRVKNTAGILNEARSGLIRHTLLIAVAGLWLSGPGLARADEITLDEAVRHALQFSPVLHGSRAGMQSAGEHYKTVKAGRLPRIDLSYDALYADNPLAALGSKLNNRNVTAEDFQPGNINHPGSFDNYRTGISVEVPLYTGGRISAETDEAAATRESAALRHERTRSVIVYETSRAYLYAQAAKQARKIARDGALAAKRHVDTTRRLLAEGRIVSSDKLTAEVYYTSVSSAIEKAESQYRRALNALKQVMGMDLAKDIDVIDWESDTTLTPIPDVAEAERIALSNRADLKAAMAAIDAAEARTRKARSGSLPQVSLFGTGDLYGNDPLTDEASWAVLAQARMNLYSGGANKTRVSAARYDRIRLEAERENKLASIRREVRDAYASGTEGERRLKLAETNLITARQAVRQINERYGEGRTILIDLLQAEQALLNSRNEWLNARLRLRESRLDILHAMDALATTITDGDAP